jgi:DNA adenine methylase
MKQRQVAHAEDSAVVRLRPFLRWAGGKQYLVREILSQMVSQDDFDVYVEPFVGAASLFFALTPTRALLADANPHLIACYRAIRDTPEAVAKSLARLKCSHSHRYYYRVRKAYNAGGPRHLQAARFIYLNRTCFNGVFRVNTRGEFNVPIGDHTLPIFPRPSELTKYAIALNRATLTVGGFEKTLEGATTKWFVYLDPPYPPLNGTSFFTHYTKTRFGARDQEQLAHAVQRLHARGARFLMTNADTPIIRSLYRQFKVRTINATRYVSCKNTKQRVSELVITNFSR